MMEVAATSLVWGDLMLAPLLPWPLLAVLAGLAFVLILLGALARLRGTLPRAIAALVILAALTGPSMRHEEREALSDIVLLLRDETASNKLGGRADATAAMAERLKERIAALPNTEVREVTLGDGPDGQGTLVVDALSRALADEPAARIAGAIAITDGQIHDPAAGAELALPAPLNVIVTGQRQDWDRALTITTAPTFGIIGEQTVIGLRIDDQGAMPKALQGQSVEVGLSIDGGPLVTHIVPTNAELELPLTLDHAGQNIVQFILAPTPGELTDQNNMAVVSVNGVRDRLRVLLVSGEPYAGERTWRNLLKSDASVDLVHFTILRPPEKEDGVPVDELALIAFPTRELFVEKINEFDLIIFDRYPMRGIMPARYLDNIRDYVEAGGALLVAAGPEFATAESLYFSGLGEVLPARPTTRVINQPFVPALSELGNRHPVTEGLADLAPQVAREDGAPWGKWERFVELENPRGDVVMNGPRDTPLLTLSHEGQGRTALLASDQAWLWARGYDGGGPQQELLRRLAHWLMKEPELEEEALFATAEGDEMLVTRRSLKEDRPTVEVTGPDGSVTPLTMEEEQPGLFQGRVTGAKPGLYRLRDGDLERVFALGAAQPREFANAVPDAERLAGVAAATNGGVQWAEDGAPTVRAVRTGRPAIGRGWIGITPRGAYRTVDLRLTPLLPPWAWLAAALGLSLAAWLWEGRRRTA
ncbi:MAG: hypothetical protein WBA91_07320 [Paracoccaceae bacterium]